MALDREKTYKSAERLLRQGKTQEGLRELRRLAEDAPRDLVTLNRIGDLLVRMGRNAEAIGYYQGIAEQFTEAGFFPKAIAILKKVLRLDADRTEALVRLGDLYTRQKLPGEARHHFLHAADKYLRAKQFTKAREVYERVVVAEPKEPLHRARLAEARAAEGDPKRAGEDLVELGRMLLEGGRVEEADKTFRRAAQLLPQSIRPVSGLAFCRIAEGRADEAVRVLEEAVRDHEGEPEALGELVLVYERVGRNEDAERLLAEPGAEGISDETLEKILRHHQSMGSVETGWARLDLLMRRWTEASNTDRLASLLERASKIEPQGHIPALQRLLELRRSEENRAGVIGALERLVRAYQSRSMHDEASLMLDQIRKMESVRGTGPDRAATPATGQRGSGAGEPRVTRPAARVASGLDEMPEEVPPPAVPLTPADEEFVTSHLTEAEVFEKYGLISEAIAQLRHVAERFPGYVVAQERLAALLGAEGDRDSLQAVLVNLAVARRAAGSVIEARDAARSADEIGPLAPSMRRLLEKLALLGPEAAEVSEESIEDDVETIEIVEETESTTRSSSAGAARVSPAEDEMEILFNDDRRAEPSRAKRARGASPSRTPSPAPAAAPSGSAPKDKTPPPDVLEEVSFFIQQGMIEDAAQKLSALRTLGFGGPALADLAARVAGATKSREEAEILVEGIEETQRAAATKGVPYDTDLGAMIASLEDELAAEEPQVAASSSPEQSIGEVFEAFKRHVQSEVGSEDFRTHYDLGIAYKEMGLLDDALEEFRVATGSPDLFADACSMLAICHRERGETDEAVKWYRDALSKQKDENPSLSGLPYDLAEVLLETGDEEGALDLFRHILASDPSYRDVGTRVSELQDRLRS